MSENCQMAHVSIIIPVYKVEKHLHKCLDSVINQTYKELEIIVVDDGSPDNCPRICDEYAQKDDRIHVVHQQNGGLSSARNTALDLAQGKYIAFLDSDDFVAPNWISRTVELLEQKNLDAVIYEATLVDGDDNITGTRFHVYDEPTEESPFTAWEKIVTDKVGSQVWKAVYRRELWQSIRFPVGRFYEDMPVTHRVYMNMSRNVLFLPECLYYYRLNDQGISFSKDNQDKKAYHIFLGFLDMFAAAQDRANEETKAICLAKTAKMAHNVLGNETKELSYHDCCKRFLKDNQFAIFSCRALSIKDKVKIFVDLYLPLVRKLSRRIKTTGGR